MIKGYIPTGTAIALNTNIPFEVAFKSNGTIGYNSTDNTFEIYAPGYYDVFLSLTLSDASATPLTILMYSDNQYIGSVSNDITVSTGVREFTMIESIRVQKAQAPSVAKISFRISGGTAETYDIGKVIIEKRR